MSDDASAYGIEDEQPDSDHSAEDGTEQDDYPDAVLEDEAPERDGLADDPELEDRS